MVRNTQVIINERRQKLWLLLTRGMRSYDIAKELKCDHSTISRDIQYLTSQSQKFLDDLAKKSLPMMYKQSIDGIREVIQEAWNIYESTDESINYFQRLAALKLIKESNEAQFKLLADGPAAFQLNVLQEKLTMIEEAAVATAAQQKQKQQQLQLTNNNQISR
jgi:IS30 family transposase